MRSLTLRFASSAPTRVSGTSPEISGAVPLSRYLVFFSLAVLGCAADLFTKEWVFAWRGMPGASEVYWLWKPFIGIETVLNPGALFGMGGGWGRVFAGLSIAAALGIPIWLFVYRAAASLWLTVSLSLIMAGVLGNLYDRLGFWVGPGMKAAWRSSVRDWILFRYGEYSWPNFNIADSLLVCGAAMLFWCAWRETPAEVSPPAAKP